MIIILEVCVLFLLNLLIIKKEVKVFGIEFCNIKICKLSIFKFMILLIK